MEGKPLKEPSTGKVPALLTSLARHGEREGYRAYDGVHRVDLTLPLPLEAMALIARLTGLELDGSTLPGIILQDTCGHHCLSPRIPLG